MDSWISITIGTICVYVCGQGSANEHEAVVAEGEDEDVVDDDQVVDWWWYKEGY